MHQKQESPTPGLPRPPTRHPCSRSCGMRRALNWPSCEPGEKFSVPSSKYLARAGAEAKVAGAGQPPWGFWSGRGGPAKAGEEQGKLSGRGSHRWIPHYHSDLAWFVASPGLYLDFSQPWPWIPRQSSSPTAWCHQRSLLSVVTHIPRDFEKLWRWV